MTLAAIIIFTIAVVLAITGGLWTAANWLWVAIVLAVIAIIMFLLRVISGRRSV